MTPLERDMAIGLGAVFLEACGQDDHERVVTLLEPVLGAPAGQEAEWARQRLGGLSTGACARLAAGFWSAVDLDRSATFRNGAYLVLRGERGPVRLAVRVSPDAIRVDPGAQLGRVLGARIRLTGRAA